MTTSAKALRGPLDLIVIAGVTGTGKTALSLAIAERYAAEGQAVEILNGDAMQFYRGMDIGTAKLSLQDRSRFPHHLFDFLDVQQNATVADFQERARDTILEIQQRGAIPVLVGGSGLYLSAVLQDFAFPPRDENLRTEFELESERPGGAERLVKRLNELDPEAAAQINHGNIRRIIRALEVVTLTGRPYASTLPENSPHWSPATQIFLDGDREVLRQRLLLRVQEMFHSGLLAEVEELLEAGLERGSTALRAIGYQQAINVLRGLSTEDEAIHETWQLTTRYARRQRSWFNRYTDIARFDYADPELLSSVMSLLQVHKNTDSLTDQAEAR